MKKLTLIFLVLATFTACGPKNNITPKQYSTWIVNGTDTFRTNNVDSSVACNPDHSYCVSGIQSLDNNNWFDITFALDYLPDSGFFEIKSNNNSTGVLLGTISFYYNNQFYYHTSSQTDTVFATYVNNKARYTMSACWFVNYDNPTGDSILIEGVFNAP